MRSAASRGIAKFALLCWCSVGSTALGHGDLHEKIEVLDALLKQNPDHVASLLERADIHRRHRNFDDALEDLNRLRSLAPTNNTVYYMTGLTLLEQGEFEEAETALRTFISRSPSSPRGHIALAKVLTQQKRHLDAAQEYELAIENQSIPTPDHYLARAHAYMEAGKPYLARALQGLEDGMALMGPLLTFHRLAIEIEIAQEDFQNAIDRINMILHEADRKETWLVKKAKVLSSMGRNEEARQQFLLAERAIALLPHRTRTSPAIQTLRKTIQEHLNHEPQEENVQNESDIRP
ncbi:MAG: tetratricopeptide repeat protein [Gammaproteobacteria bacterium]|nr:tetratricopeptide repeat protein [Gammaproteobacteria bacterium]